MSLGNKTLLEYDLNVTTSLQESGQKHAETELQSGPSKPSASTQS